MKKKNYLISFIAFRVGFHNNRENIYTAPLSEESVQQI